jgi:hypothetical protein
MSYRQRTLLHVELLEGREVPATVADQALVALGYQGFLGRNPDALGLPFWSGQFDAGATPVQVASGLLASTEYRGRAVADLYPALLGRPADLGGLGSWVGSLQAGATLDDVRAAILASDEFFANSGSTPGGFLDALYQHVLGRQPDAVGRSVFGAAAGMGTDARRGVASQVLGSDESIGLRLDNAYREILGRHVDAIGGAFWGGALRAGQREEAVLAGIFASDEVLGQLGSAVAGGTSPVQAATQLVAANHLFEQVPGAVAPAGMTPQDAAFLVQSPAFGPITLPAGFHPVGPSVGAGDFGPDGFVPEPVPVAPAAVPPLLIDPGNAANPYINRPFLGQFPVFT